MCRLADKDKRTIRIEPTSIVEGRYYSRLFAGNEYNNTG
jgi:hypothetical protein